MSATEIKTTARNLWFNPRSGYSHQAFTYWGKPLFSYRGVEVFESNCSGFHYVLDGAVITMRHGFRKETAPAIIDEILDGNAPQSPQVCALLEPLGFKPISFSQYIADWEAGLRASPPTYSPPEDKRNLISHET